MGLSKGLFASFLCYHRIESGMTQSQLAKKVGVGSTFISRLETAKKTPPWALVPKLIKELKLTDRDEVEFRRYAVLSRWPLDAQNFADNVRAVLPRNWEEDSAWCHVAEILGIDADV